jgi:uncharacterized glyoxalase superfamily protein PhnB
MMPAPKAGNLVPYLFCGDAESLIDWYSRVFGFVEKDRWLGDDGRIRNAEMSMGDTELWLDGGGGQITATGSDGSSSPVWIGVWLETPAAVDEMYEHIVAQGVKAEDEPVDRPFGVRIFNVRDPAGYLWGFMSPIPRTDDR